MKLSLFPGVLAQSGVRTKPLTSTASGRLGTRSSLQSPETPMDSGEVT